MRERAPFQPADLHELAALLDAADAVVPMCEIADGTSPNVIGLRHDVDNTIAEAVRFAEWEHERGYQATYFIEHTAPYWQDKDTLRAALETINDCGHEIGLHVNAITASLETGRDPLAIVADAVGELRTYGYEIRGVVAHGDQACYQHKFVNDEIFTESARPKYGDPDRLIAGKLFLQPVSRMAFGFDYDPNWLPRAVYLSDSGGQWQPQPFEYIANGYPFPGQLHMLIHPCWWAEAFVEVAV